MLVNTGNTPPIIISQYAQLQFGEVFLFYNLTKTIFHHLHSVVVFSKKFVYT